AVVEGEAVLVRGRRTARLGYELGRCLKRSSAGAHIYCTDRCSRRGNRSDLKGNRVRLRPGLGGHRAGIDVVRETIMPGSGAVNIVRGVFVIAPYPVGIHRPGGNTAVVVAQAG